MVKLLPSVRSVVSIFGWQVAEERLGSSTSPDRQFVWGPLGIDNLILRDRPGSSERLYAFANTISVTAIVDASGTVVERYGYNAYGAVNVMTPAFAARGSSSYDWEILTNSYRYDVETGYYQVRNRYLHPTLGRWLTRDPIGYAGGLNLYAYCGNSPVNRVDPYGEFTLTEALVAVVIVVLIVGIVVAPILHQMEGTPPPDDGGDNDTKEDPDNEPPASAPPPGGNDPPMDMDMDMVSNGMPPAGAMMAMAMMSAEMGTMNFDDQGSGDSGNC